MVEPTTSSTSQGSSLGSLSLALLEQKFAKELRRRVRIETALLRAEIKHLITQDTRLKTAESFVEADALAELLLLQARLKLAAAILGQNFTDTLLDSVTALISSGLGNLAGGFEQTTRQAQLSESPSASQDPIQSVTLHRGQTMQYSKSAGGWVISNVDQTTKVIPAVPGTCIKLAVHTGIDSPPSPEPWEPIR
jgi:hypothetical protein